MAYDGKVLRQATLRFDEDKQRRQEQQRQRQQQVYQQCPELEGIQREIRGTQGQGGLAAAGTACNANDQIIHSRNSSCTKTLSAPVEKPTEMDYNRRNQRSAGAACGPAAFCSIYHTIKCPVLTARKGGRVQFFQLAGGLPRRKQTRCKHNSCSRT